MTTSVRAFAALLLAGAVSAGPGPAAAKPKLDPESAKFYQTARLIMTKEEVKIFERLPDAGSRKEFIADFWLKRDPDPDTPDNAFQKEFEARVAFVNKRFNKEGGPGYNTDRGRVYILMGPPEKVEEFSPEVGASVRGEVPTEIVEALASKGGILAVDVQGFLRVVRNGTLVSDGWPGKEAILRHVTVLKTDAVEAELITGESDRHAAAKALASFGPSGQVMGLLRLPSCDR